MSQTLRSSKKYDVIPYAVHALVFPKVLWALNESTFKEEPKGLLLLYSLLYH